MRARRAHHHDSVSPKQKLDLSEIEVKENRTLLAISAGSINVSRIFLILLYLFLFCSGVHFFL